ncbi:FimV/HubP family polar landmark protein [Agarilytica rhodophyticola]|uniref:FimV/HubP family polar landmark protein n=1 Tax=Agarilytica rhodophyticola TaxID=1737490 RepID=UPI0013158EB0|nr:FimV/HubP family polar landmark protein [Agarilytica rhodophyticola]
MDEVADPRLLLRQSRPDYNLNKDLPMGHRSIILLASVLFTFLASNALALGVGKIKLESSLNQPLQAQIELFEVRDLTPTEIRVSIASREDFDRIGVDKIFFLSDIKFDIDLDDPSGPTINVSSRKVVREPFLNFIVQVQWPSGKLLREYTLLMDLPVYANQDAPPVRQSTTRNTGTSQTAQTPRYQPPAPTKQTSTAPASNDRSSFEDAPPRPSQAPVTPSYTGDSYSVQANDTLWEIATQVRPNRSVSIYQTMIAIQRANPEAFINENINLLKKGQILRIPNADEMASLNQGDAVREVSVQNNVWSGSDGEVDDAQLSGANVYDSGSSDSGNVEGRVKLTSPDDSFDSNEGRSSGGAADSSVDALENELAITLEQLDKSGKENTELRSKVSSLEEQIETMERMLEVSNENLRALELAAKKNAEEVAAQEDDIAAAGVETDNTDGTGEEAPEDTSGGSESIDDLLDTYNSGNETSGDVAGSEGASEGEGVEGAVEDSAAIDGDALDSDSAEAGLDEENTDLAEEATPTPTPTTAAKRVVIPPPPVEKSIVDILLDNILYLVGGIVVLAVGVFFFLKKKSSDEDDFDEFMQDHGGVEATDDALEQEDEFDLDGDLPNFDEGDSDSLAEAGEQEDPESADETEQQTEDVVAEADIYIAYGKYDQAEEMLLKVLTKDPSDQEVRLKLLEVYSAQGDAQSFDPHYAKLMVFASPANIERAEELRNTIPGIAAFDETGFDTSDVQQYAGGLDDSFSADDDNISISDDSVEDDGLEFDGLGIGDSADTSDALVDLDSGSDPINFDAAPEGEELDLDFDLDLPEGDDSETSFDLELDLPDESDENKATEDDLSEPNFELDSGLDLDNELDSELSLDSNNSGLDYDDDVTQIKDYSKPDDGAADADISIEESLDLDTDLGDFSGDDSSELDIDDLSIDLGGDSDVSLSESLESDLASLDADLDLSLDGGDEEQQSSTYSVADGLDMEDTLIRSEPPLSMQEEDLAASSDDDDLSEFELDTGLDHSDLDAEDDLSSDTVVNKALNDDYIEQRLSAESDDEILNSSLSLESEVDDIASGAAAGDSQSLDSLDLEADDADLDLSSLDEELDALTSGMDEGASGTDDLMAEPVTDFDDFEDDLAKDEAMAETVKSDHAGDTNVADMGDDNMFDQAISEVPSTASSDVEFEIPEVNPDDLDDDDLDFLSDSDEVATKLDLARAYIDMGDQEGARDIIREVVGEGTDQQKTEAENLLARIDS